MLFVIFYFLKKPLQNIKQERVSVYCQRKRDITIREKKECYCIKVEEMKEENKIETGECEETLRMVIFFSL